MSKLAVELLKFGIDSPTALKQKFRLKKCVSFEYEDQQRDEIINVINENLTIEDEPDDPSFSL